MQFLEKQFQSWVGYVLAPTGIESLAELIRSRIDLTTAFTIYQGREMYDDERPIIWHAWEFQGDLLAPIISYPDTESYRWDENGRKVYMLDLENHEPKIIQVPTGIPLIWMRDSYRYMTALQKFYTTQSVEQILDGLRTEGWKDFLYTKKWVWPMDFTLISELRKNLAHLE